MKQDKLKKVERRLKQYTNTVLLKLPKLPNFDKKVVPYQYTVSRPVMFRRLLEEVKDEFYKKSVQGTRQERRRRMIALARKTMRMMREEHQLGG